MITHYPLFTFYAIIQVKYLTSQIVDVVVWLLSVGDGVVITIVRSVLLILQRAETTAPIAKCLTFFSHTLFPGMITTAIELNSLLSFVS